MYWLYRNIFRSKVIQTRRKWIRTRPSPCELCLCIRVDPCSRPSSQSSLSCPWLLNEAPKLHFHRVGLHLKQICLKHYIFNIYISYIDSSNKSEYEKRVFRVQLPAMPKKCLKIRSSKPAIIFYGNIATDCKLFQISLFQLAHNSHEGNGQHGKKEIQQSTFRTLTKN